MGVDCLDTPPAQLAATLRRCTALQHLQLGQLKLDWLPDGRADDNDGDQTVEQRLDQAKAAGMEAVAAAIARLPNLQSIRLLALPLSVRAAATLAAAAAGTQLTRLQLAHCGVTAAGLSAVALRLSNLRDLEVHVDGDVDAAIPVLGRLLLQRLKLGHGWNSCKLESFEVFLPNWRSLMRSYLPGGRRSLA